MSQYTRMVIVEAINDESVRHVRNFLDAHMADLNLEPGFISARRLREDGGNMVVFESSWFARDSCLRYHASRSYRQLVARMEPYVMGNPVVKLFESSVFTLGRRGNC